ncbi:MAG: hypothetical protein LBU61_05335 [Coriobacteriales bacterium]|jgi:hypothetical protein|nr:hypothetical protein [Coriobacteriales bacterium]
MGIKDLYDTAGVDINDAAGSDSHDAAGSDISRRGFLAASAVAGVGTAVLAASVATGLVGCDLEEPAVEDEFAVPPTPAGEDPVTLKVSVEQLLEATLFDERPLFDYLRETNRYYLPYGTIVYQIDNNSALALTPNDQGKALVEFKLLDLNSGQLTPLLNRAVGSQKSHPDAILYDGRASDSLLAWTEYDISNFHWQVYVAPITAEGLGDAVLIDEGDPDYEVPLIAIEGDKVYWTVMPNPDGPAQYEDSYLKAMVYDRRQPWIVYTSHGRISTSPLISQGVLTFAPRVDTKNIYYQLTALSTATDRPIAWAIMPQSVRVYEAIYLDKNFSFSIENNYSYAEGLGFYGTYMPLPLSDYWLHLSRKPSAPPVMLNGRLVVKSATRVIGIDAVDRIYYSIPPVADSADYGDTLAGWGLQDRLVIYSNVRSRGSQSVATGVVRVFSPVIKEDVEEPAELSS